MEIVGSMASTVVELLFDPIRRSVTRVFYYSRNVNSLETHMKELSDMKTRVLHSVEEATNKTEEIEDDVVTWLDDVDAITEKADRVLKDEDKAKKRCFMGLFPNLMTRYRVSTEIKSIEEEAVKISRRGKFDRVSYLPAPRGIGDRSVKDYEAFESRRHVLDEILEALKDNDVNLVGVWGMPGVGKTTIVKKVAEQVKANRIFDVVVLAVVSETPDLRRIQGEIADGLGFKFEEETIRGRAERLRERLERRTKGLEKETKVLERETKVLVILDDIWERLELDDVGIPSGSDNRGCKILMTSRDRNALCRRMDTKKLFHLEVLLENEAWNLFKNMAGDAIKNPDLQRVAVEVAKKCAGLPIYLVTVASALKDGDLSEWKDALERLKRFDKDEINSPVNSALELSYTSLKGEEIKSVFLLCGQLQPHHIRILELLKYTVGLGLFKRISTLEEARHRLNKLVNDLIASCLLEGGADGIVKMHDVLHGFAASVASRDHHVFTPDTVFGEWPAKDMLEQYSAISLPYCKISGLPEVLNCPKLESFILYNEEPSLKIPDCLFKGTKTLQLMDMTDVQLPTLPSSLQFLEKLQTLCLDRCGLGDIALIGELKMLKVLSLVDSNIVRLPREIGQLTRLQLLDLTDNPTLEIIPPNVLSCLTQLEDLYMENSFLQWRVEGLDDRRNNASLAELKDLPKLSTLYFNITDPMILPKDFFSKKLERFHILIGEGWDWSSEHETSTMKLKISASIQSEEGIQLLLKRTEDLYLDGLEDVKSVSYELDGQGFPSLKHLHIQNSLEIRYIVDSTMLSPIVAFPFLVSLSLDNLNKLEKICNGQPVAESFSKLRFLKVKSCPMLKNLFSLHMERGLLQLEEISIIDCKIMEVIVAEESGGEDEAIKLTQLRTLTLEYLPQFTSVSSKSNAASISQTRPEPLITDVRLTSLIVEGCRNLKYLFTTSMVESLAQLKRLELRDCVSMEEIIIKNGLGEEENVRGVMLPKLEFLKLKGLPNLTRFCSELSYWFVRLTSLIVEGCRNLKYLFTTSMVESLAQLKRLELCDCVSMEEIIIKNGLGEEENVRGMMLPKLEFLKLKGLPNLSRFCTAESFSKLRILKVKSCPMLKNLFSLHMERCLLQLEEITIIDCKIMEVIVAEESGGGADEDEAIKLTQLRTLTLEYLPQFTSSLSTDAVSNNQFEETNSTLFDENVAFSNIEKLHIVGMDNLNMIWHTEFHSDSFCKLKVLKVKQGNKLLNIFPPNMLRRFQNLEHLEVDYCASLEEVFDLRSLMSEKESHVVTAFKLKNMYVWNLQKLKKVWNTNPHGILSFQNLHLVNAWKCPSLKSLFPTSVAIGLPQLEELKLHNCGVEEIVAEEERLGGAPKFVFPKTSSFILWDLPKLKSFYPGRHTSEWPVLKKIDVYLCDEVLVFDSELQSTQGACTQDQRGIQVQQPLFSFEKVIPNLEELSLNIKDAAKVCQGQFSTDLFHRLRVLELQCFDGASAEFPFGILHIFQNMEKLVVTRGYFKELFPCQLVDEEEHTLARIRCLELFNLPDLEKIWNQDLRVDQLLQNLETLEVRFCDNLINLAPSASTFRNLTALHVRDCKALKYLVTSSTARSLVQLSVMSIKECKMVTEIVARNGDEAGNEIIFRKLESLKLDCLPSLTSFCSVNFTFRFPCLTEVIVTNCPKMKTFSLGILSTPMLQKIRYIVDSTMLNPVVDFPFLVSLSLDNLNKLEKIYNGQPVAESFSKLRILKVKSCPMLKNLFSLHMERGLLQLEEISIIDCKIMEVIVAEESGGGADEDEAIKLTQLRTLTLEYLPQFTSIWQDQPGELSCWFVRLTSLIVEGCRNLKYLFITSMVESLAQLKRLELHDCVSMEEIIIKNGLGEEENVRGMILPKLEFLKLKGLPNLTRFCTGHLIQCCFLQELWIEDCPALKTFISNSKSTDAVANNQFGETNSTLFDEKLKNMYVWNLQKLKKVWNTNPHGILSFQNLHLVNALKCPSLKSLFPASVALGLPKLEELKLRLCGVEEIVAEEERLGEAPKFVFPRTSSFILWDLPKLKSFYPGRHTSEWTVLKKIDVHLCHEVPVFDPELQSTQGAGIQVRQPLFSFEKV
ncbi:disease resistance protein [Salix suchowensis]|nr:disease resistance protein [Salix suchowensis]